MPSKIQCRTRCILCNGLMTHGHKWTGREKMRSMIVHFECLRLIHKNKRKVNNILKDRGIIIA